MFGSQFIWESGSHLFKFFWGGFFFDIAAAYPGKLVIIRKLIMTGAESASRDQPSTAELQLYTAPDPFEVEEPIIHVHFNHMINVNLNLYVKAKIPTKFRLKVTSRKFDFKYWVLYELRS